MTTFTNVPKQVEDGLDHSALTPSRRKFLKSAGLLVVSFSAAGKCAKLPQLPRVRARITTPTFINSIPGS